MFGTYSNSLINNTSESMLFLYPMYNRLSDLLLVDVMLSVVESRVNILCR